MTPHLRLLAPALAIALITVAAGCSKSTDAPVPTVAAGASATMAEGTPVPKANVSDIDVTEHVKTALQQTESLRGTDIAVVTLKGDVRLTGVLERQAQIDDALRIARTAEGAHAIHDELTLAKAAP